MLWTTLLLINLKLNASLNIHSLERINWTNCHEIEVSKKFWKKMLHTTFKQEYLLLWNLFQVLVLILIFPKHLKFLKSTLTTSRKTDWMECLCWAHPGIHPLPMYVPDDVYIGRPWPSDAYFLFSLKNFKSGVGSNQRSFDQQLNALYNINRW